MMQPLGSVTAVAAAVREDAAAEAERVAREAAAELARLEAPDDAPALEAPERAARLATARRLALETRAAEDAADARAALELRERWMELVADTARRRLVETAADRRARLQRLMAEARTRLPAGEVVVTLAPADVPLVEGARADPTMTPGGLRVATADGRLTIDETLEARARRFESAWRAALGKIWG